MMYIGANEVQFTSMSKCIYVNECCADGGCKTDDGKVLSAENFERSVSFFNLYLTTILMSQ